MQMHAITSYRDWSLCQLKMGNKHSRNSSSSSSNSSSNSKRKSTAMTASPASTAKANALPPGAAAGGYNKLVFCDDFDSESSISDGKRGNTNWYTTGWFSPTAPRSCYKVSNSVLHVLSDVSGCGFVICSADPTHTKNAWKHGYFEASLSFDPSAPTDKYPSFWSWPIEFAQAARIGHGGPKYYPEYVSLANIQLMCLQQSLTFRLHLQPHTELTLWKHTLDVYQYQAPKAWMS